MKNRSKLYRELTKVFLLGHPPNIYYSTLLQIRQLSVVKLIHRYLPITVKFTLTFLVGEFLKSTLHLYTASSSNWILSINNLAGFVLARNIALLPNAADEDHSFAWLWTRLRMSKLYRKIIFINSYYRCSSMKWTMIKYTSSVMLWRYTSWKNFKLRDDWSSFFAK